MSHGNAAYSSTTLNVTRVETTSDPPSVLKEEEENQHEISVNDVDEETERLLHTDFKTGLTDREVEERRAIFGFNEIEEKRISPFKRFFLYFTGPISYLIEVTCILSGILHEWIDFGIMVSLLFVNAFIGFHEESKAENALDALKANLATKTRVFRNSNLIEIDTRELVPGDILILRLGDIVPADCRLLGVDSTGSKTDSKLQVDQAALTGESLPVDRGRGDIVYSSSIIKQGQMLAVVSHTGLKTFIGRAANLISITNEQGHFQKIVGAIGNFLIVVTVFFAAIIFAVKMVNSHQEFKEILLEVLTLTIAAIPVGLPTVLSVTMAVGAKKLAAKEVIVKRLPAIEEFASVSILCSDKTGTLTLNELTFDKPFLAHQYTAEDLLLYAYLASEPGARDPIEFATRTAALENVALLKNLPKGQEHLVPGYKVNKFTPFNPSTKYTHANVTNTTTTETFECVKGAPQVIIRLVGGDPAAERAVIDFAQRGLRALGVAKTSIDNPSGWELVGLISLLDPPRPDSGETIRECAKLGVEVKMITGDQVIIGKEVARRLGMQRCILNASKLVDPKVDEEELTRRCEKSDGFGQVIPEHKYKVVELLQKKGHLVGMTGDGVNDAPALKKANVGIAVEGCTDAARSAADIVLLAPGLSTIVDGIKESRAIFQRMRSYAIYRITSTIHILIFFFLSILAYDFTLPAKLLILIAVLNDIATLVIAIDNAKISKRPDKWRLGQLMFMSTVLAILLTIASFAHYWVGESLGMTKPELQTILYLQISSCPHFVIFSTRVGTYFWLSPPSFLFTLAVGGTQVFAMFMSIFGIPYIAEPIGWAWGISIMCMSVLVMSILDLVKVFIFKQWSFKFTATAWPVPSRRRKLQHKIHAQRSAVRYRANVNKLRKVVSMCNVVVAMRKSDGVQQNLDLGHVME